MEKRNSLKSDIIINATSVGMYPKIEEVPINEDMIKRSQIVVDAISNPIQTKLIKLAKNIKKYSVRRRISISPSSCSIQIIHK